MTWQIVCLADVAEVRLGRQRAPKNHSGDSMRPYIRAANVTWAGLDLTDVKTMNFTDVEMATYRMEPGDIVLSEASGSPGEVGKPALWAGEISECGFQNTLIRVRPREHDPKFLVHYFRYLALDGQFVEYSRGVGIHHIGRTRLASWPTPLPQLDEQHRIVDLLEDHLSRLDAAEHYLASGLCRVDVWYRQLLASALWSADYPRARVGDLLREPMRNGRSDRAATGGGAGTRSLTLTAVTKNAFTEANTKVTVTTPDKARDLWLEPGDVFVQRSNTPALVGTAARYHGPREWAIFPDLLIRLRANEDKIDSRFLAAALQSKPGHDQLRRSAKGLAGSMPKIDQSAIANTSIPLPPVDQQQRLLAIIEDAADALALLRGELAAAQRRSRILRRALLKAAFSGRLTAIAPDMSEVAETICE